jgi:hypothetical protein
VSERVEYEFFRESQRLTDGRMRLIEPGVREARAIYAAEDEPGWFLLALKDAFGSRRQRRGARLAVLGVNGTHANRRRRVPELCT